MQLDVTQNLDAVARGAAGVLRGARESAMRTLYELDPCPPELYLKIHERVRQMAADHPDLNGARTFHLSPLTSHRTHSSRRSRSVCAPTAGDVDSYVTPVKPKMGQGGGDRVVDYFSIKESKLLEKLIGEFNEQGDGALMVNGRTSVLSMALPKVHFYFKTKRTGHKPRVQLVVKGHIGRLLPPQAGNGTRFSFAKTYDDQPMSQHAFKLAFKAAAARDASLVQSQALRDFLLTVA